MAVPIWVALLELLYWLFSSVDYFTSDTALPLSFVFVPHFHPSLSSFSLCIALSSLEAFTYTNPFLLVTRCVILSYADNPTISHQVLLFPLEKGKWLKWLLSLCQHLMGYVLMHFRCVHGLPLPAQVGTTLKVITVVLDTILNFFPRKPLRNLEGLS